MRRAVAQSEWDSHHPAALQEADAGVCGYRWEGSAEEEFPECTFAVWGTAGRCSMVLGTVAWSPTTQSSMPYRVDTIVVELETMSCS